MHYLILAVYELFCLRLCVTFFCHTLARHISREIQIINIWCVKNIHNPENARAYGAKARTAELRVPGLGVRQCAFSI